MNNYDHKEIDKKWPHSAEASRGKQEYNHREIESKWQEVWNKNKLYKTEEDPSKPKSFVLDMFPYPSGEGLHVGHPKGYIATDIYSRMKKMQGHNVLHPMGWDAFGLPAENFAIKHKIHPRVAVEKNIQRFKEQLSKIGFNYDWGREINTTDPEYYKWTQWIFLKMLEKGLAYESYEPINWCPSCQTGLANEDLESDGTCERCGSVVEKRPMRQWVLKITEYADRMLEDLKLLDWPEYIKEAQRNWIGRSEGMLFSAPVKDTDLKIQTFSAHFEGFAADTFVVIAPDHPFLPQLVKGTEKEKEVLEFAQKLVEKRLAQGFAAEKESEGIFTGRYIVDPVGNGDLPIWVASYALADYGTGIVKCSAHDERDFAFAKKYNVPLKEVLIPRMIDYTNPHVEGKKVVFRKAVIVLLKNPKTGEILTLKWKKQPWVTFVMGGIEEGETPEQAAEREIKEETGYQNIKNIKILGGPTQAEFFAAHKDENRITNSWLAVAELADETQESLSDEEAAIHELEWVDPEKIDPKKIQHSEAALILDRMKNGVKAWTDMKNSVLLAPEQFKGKIAGEVRQEIIEYLEKNKLAEKKTTYKIKDWVFSRQRYWGEPIPVIHCEECGVVGVPEKDLPVRLPDVENYQPTGTGESPLANIENWVNTTCPKCGGAARRETNTMPQWAGSSWYYLRFMDPKNSEKLVDPKKEKYWAPVDVYVGGDHAVRHLIYARFWHKFLFDIGSVSTEEPFARLEFLGFILAKDGRKMSKRWGNVINPDDIVDLWGADTLRLYEMFMGPFENTIAWKDESLIGVRRFLERSWKFAHGNFVDQDSQEKNQKIESLLHKTIKKVTEDIEGFKFNTAISTMMILLNEFEANKDLVSKEYVEVFLKLLAPFAPHMAEEIWSGFGNQKSIHLEEWPKFDELKTKETEVKIMVQVNGRVRANFVANAGISEEEAKKQALAMPEVQKWIQGLSIEKTIFVVDKLLNIVVK